MDRKRSILIFLGMLIGAQFGIFLGKAIDNMLLGIGIGALAGLIIGWFIVAAIRENR